MKRKLLLPVLALTAFLGTLLSCSSDSGTASIKIPVTQIFRNVENDILPSDTNKIKLEITLSGDAKDSHEFNWEEKEQNCTFENLPVGGVVSVSAKVKDGKDLIYSGESDKIKLKNEQNETTITMQKHLARLTIKTDNKEIAGLSDKTEIAINATAEGFSGGAWTITPKEFADGYELKYLPATGKVTITANVKDGEKLLFSGSHVAENIMENQGALTIQMTKHLARLTVKTDNKEIAGLTDKTEIVIDAAAEGFQRSRTITPKEFADGYEIKYLPTNKELTVTVEAKTKDTAIFRGSSKITIAENDQKPECTIKMERVNGDETSVEIRALPTPVLEAISANDNNTFSLKQDSEARFTIYYTDSSTPNLPHKPLPEWVTYKWKMNDTEFTPNDGSGQATFGMNEEGTELTLTISLKKLKSLLLQGSDVGSTQNRLYVEIGMENSEETKSTEIEFTITQ